MRVFFLVCVSFVVCALSVTGCGISSPKDVAWSVDSSKSMPMEHAPLMKAPSGGEGEVYANGMTGHAALPAKQEDVAATATQRKIIYTARIGIVVDNFDGLEERIRHAVEQHGGYLANVNLDQMQGERRTGRWTVRIPVDRYDEFMAAAGELGVPTSQVQDAEDVTEEFVDLTARIENKKKLEERILELLDRPDDKIQHVIEVEKELARVREEIERMQGRLRYLTDQTSMTTIHISAREERNYAPPKALTLGNRVATAWSNSISNTTRFIQDLIVFLAGNMLPLLTWSIGLVMAWMIGRRLWKKHIVARNA